MAKFYISEVNVIEGYLYEKWAEDGKIVVFDCLVQAICEGAVYHHKHVFKGAFQDEHEGYYHVDRGAINRAHTLADRVSQAGIIDTEHWNSIGHVDDISKSEAERKDESWSDYSDWDLG